MVAFGAVDSLMVGIIAGVGVLVVSLVFVLARTLGQRKPPEPAPPAPPPTPPPDPEEARGADRREYPRRRGSPAPVLIKDAKDQYHGWILDRSSKGMRLETTIPFAPGTILQVSPLNAPRPAPWVEVEVRYCRQQGKEVHLGCQFTKIPTWNILLLFE